MIKVRLCFTVTAENPVESIEELWKEFELPFVPYPGTQFNLSDPVENVVEVESLQWCESGILIAFMEGIDARYGDGLFNRDEYAVNGWKTKGLWRP